MGLKSSNCCWGATLGQLLSLAVSSYLSQLWLLSCSSEYPEHRWYLRNQQRRGFAKSAWQCWHFAGLESRHQLENQADATESLPQQTTDEPKEYSDTEPSSPPASPPVVSNMAGYNHAQNATKEFKSQSISIIWVPCIVWSKYLPRLSMLFYILSRLGSICLDLAGYPISCHALAVSA